MEAAFEVFTAQGYEATAISAVAARAGIGQGTVYRYFGSKREILDHVIDFGVEKVIDSVRIPDLVGTAKSLDDLMDALRAAVYGMYDLLEREPRVLRLLLVEAGAIDPELAQRLFGLEAVTATLVAGELARGVREGWIRADIDPPVIAHAILTLVVPVLLRELHGISDPPARERTATMMLQLLDKTLRARRAAS
ncbi:TetR/AcrR family transcriptional regulator [Nocardia sp. NPDC058058]|uniref:TetR/AcrR family transcriptional regulator n=1 Tax=Nocardia sp. NPDC058058 TaxID=3346317 RepID=UPI0036D88B3F